MNIRLILVVVIVCLYGFLLKPWWGEYKEQNQEINIQETQISAIQKELKKLREQEAKPQSNDEVSIGKIPKHNEQEQIIRDIERIAEVSGFRFSSLTFNRGIEAASNAKKVNINISLKGPYDRLFFLLSSLQQNDRFIGIKDLRLSSNIKDGTRNAAISLSLFALHQE